MTKPFDTFDQSVPAPEFGVGVGIRFTHSDLRAIEKFADAEFGKVVTSQNLDLLAGLTNWSWLDFALAKVRVDTVEELLTHGLKDSDGATHVIVDWENPPEFSLRKYAEKVALALMASLEGMTVEEVKAKRKEAEAEFKAEQNPPQAQAEAS
jgi:hypothetical protein